MSKKPKLPSSSEQARFRATLIEHRQKSPDAERFTHNALREIYVATDLMLTPEDLTRFMAGEPLAAFVPDKSTAGNALGYSQAKTHASLVGAVTLCALWSVTAIFGIRWLQPLDVLIATPDALGEGTGSLWMALNYFLETALTLLAVIGGAIAAYRGALKLNAHGIIIGAVVLVSMVPPVAVVVHGVLLFRLHKLKSDSAEQASEAVARAKRPWILALGCLAVAIMSQIFLGDASRKAATAKAEITAITSPEAVQELMEDAAVSRLYFGSDYESALFSRAQAMGQRREMAEGRLAVANRSANIAIMACNTAVLVALGFVIVWGLIRIRSKHAVGAMNALPATMRL